MSDDRPGEQVDRWKPQPRANGTGATTSGRKRPLESEAAHGGFAGPSGAGAGDHRDELPANLDAAGFVGPYLFPDNRRRRIPAAIYAAVGAAMGAVWLAHPHGGVLVNGGFAGGGAVFLAVGAYHRIAGYPLVVQDLEALAAAGRTVGFPVGHASAQLGWRGLRSRPTWRILLYSNDDPPSRRGLVQVDAVDGEVIDHFVEDNPEDWSEFDR